MPFVSDAVNLKRVLDGASRLVHDHRRLPDMVFRRPPKRCAFLQWGAMDSADLWLSMAALARHYGDTHVTGCGLHPDPEASASLIGRFDGFELPLTTAPEEYVGLLREISPGPYEESIVMTTDVLVLYLPSGGAVLWAEHTAEFGVLGLYDSATSTSAESIAGRGIDWATAFEILQATSVERSEITGHEFEQGLLSAYGEIPVPERV